jgi:hypothetical protein
MPRSLRRILLQTALGVAPLAAAHPQRAAQSQEAVAAQTPDSSWSLQLCRMCPARRPALAVGQTFLTNVVVNRGDDWIGQQAWARVSPRSWASNFRLGWEWDENGFLVNMFAHPVHGAAYFNTGRSNGLTYWESVPLAFLGSFTWEYLGETHRPALNDFFMTSFGGVALGEVFHRVATSIRDNRKTGGVRTGRELMAFPFDPVGSANRLARGQWKETGENPADHDPGSYVFRLAAGARATVDTGVVENVLSSTTIVADLHYGNIFERPFVAPFDAFDVRLQASTDRGGLNSLRAVGRIFSKDLNSVDNWQRQVLLIRQRFDYVNNPAFKFGAQSLEFGLASRWNLLKGYRIRTEAMADAVILGALDAPSAGFGERTYDFGPGVGVKLSFELERNGVVYAGAHARTEFVHSVSGAQADHLVGIGGLEFAIPIARHLGIGLHTLYFSRRSVYSGGLQDDREYPEARLLLNWTFAARESQPPAR